MLSFKQYLKEETSSFPDFVLKFGARYTIDLVNRRKIEFKFEKYPNCDFCEVTNNEIIIILKYNSISSYHEETLDDIFYDIKDELEDVIYDINSGENTIASNERFLSYQSGELPTFAISYHHIEIVLDPNTDLSNLYKMISGCETLTFENFKNLKPTKGFLNILKIKAKNIFFQNIGPRNDLIKILQKHIKGDRDIVKCRSELIEAGLKEFAKL